MPVLVVILGVPTAVSMPAAQKPTFAPNQNHVVLTANNPSALQTALDAASTAGLHVLFGSLEGVFLSRVRVPEPPGTYRVIRENSSDRLKRALNTAGEQSFRLHSCDAHEIGKGNTRCRASGAWCGHSQSLSSGPRQ
jgi:hypothetical protein